MLYIPSNPFHSVTQYSHSAGRPAGLLVDGRWRLTAPIHSAAWPAGAQDLLGRAVEGAASVGVLPATEGYRHTHSVHGVPTNAYIVNS